MPRLVLLACLASLCLSLTSARAQSNVTVVAVDPPERLVGTVLGEWAAAGDLQNWSSSDVTSLGAAEGALVGQDTSSAADGALTLATLAGGPDLDLGFNDYLQIRLKLPASYAGDVRFDYGTTTRTGFHLARRFVIPAASLIHDGQFHTYRLDLGLEVFWRDFLRDLRITPLIDATGRFELDYIEVGDVPGTAPALNLVTNFPSQLNAANTQRLASKHACIWWDPTNSAFTLAHARRGLRMTEESYQVFCKKLGYNEPFRTFDSTTTPRQKINFLTWYDGFWAGGWNDRGHMNMGVGGLLDEGWGSPVPHEFAHVVQMAQPGRMQGGHWESHANYLRAQRNLHFSEVIPGVSPGIDNLTANSNYRPDHPRHIYADQRYYLSLDNFGTGFGLPTNFTASAWSAGQRDRTLIEKIAAALPPTTAIQNVAAEANKYWPMLDFTEKDRLRQQHWGTTSSRLLHFWRQGAQLVPLQDRPGWWRVPPERAPDSWAYQMHVLDAAPGSTITAELRGIDKAGSGEGWRWSLAAISPGDQVRYSPVYPPGTQAFTLEASETRVFLIVTATPDDVALDLDSYSNTKPIDKHPDRRRYGYEVRLTNATPAPNRYAVADPAGFRLHPNGGGVVGPSATVSTSAYVGPNAKVLGSARVEGNARIEDYAVIQGNARVRGDAIVSGFALVEGGAVVEGDARVRDRAHLLSGTVRGHALITGYVRIENTTLADDVIVRGNAQPLGGTVGGTAILDHDYSMGFSFSDGVHFNHVPWGGWWDEYQTQTLRKPRGLAASYRCAEPDGEEWWDEFGALHAQLRGAPARTHDGTSANTFLHFDGLDDYVVLDRSLADTPRFTFTIWLRPAIAPDISQPILFLGRSAQQALRLDRNASGRATLSIGDGNTIASLTGTSVLAENQWAHLSVQLDGTTARLFVNGILEASATTSLTPLSVLAPNDHVAVQANYLARDWAGGLFSGALDDARFFNVALTAAEIRAEMHRRGALVGHFATRVAQVFDGTATIAQSGVPNGRVRTLSAWVRPRSSDDVSNYEAVFDSGDEVRNRSGSGLGLDNGRWVVRLDGVGLWQTNVPVELTQWQHVALAFNGTLATLFINGTQAATRSYSGPVSDADAAGKSYRIGYSQTAAEVGSRQFFDGEILNARIHDRALTAAQLTLDADGDGFTDPVEVAVGADPLDPASTPITYPATGTVRDHADAPLAGVTIAFRHTPGLTDAPVFTVTTDALGRFTFPIPAGTWFVRATASGYIDSPTREILVTGEDLPDILFTLERTLYTLVEDFDDYTVGNFSGTTTATTVWTTNTLTTTTLVAVQDDGASRYLAQGWSGGTRGASRPVTPIPEAGKGVYHFRVRTTTQTPNASFGLSDLAPGSAFTFSDYEAQVLLIANAGQIELRARNGASFQTLATGLSIGVWYDLWLIIDNQADTYDVHLGTSGQPDQLGPRVARRLGFRNGPARNPLVTFLALSSPHADLAAHLDDLHHSPDAATPALLADIGLDAANGTSANTLFLTAAQLNALPDVSGALASREADYIAYLITHPTAFSQPATPAELRAMIAAVNAIAATPPLVSDIVYHPASGITITVRGLNPAATYRLLRGVELPEFSTEILRKQPVGETDVFTDPAPPSPRAFYIVEQL